MMNASTPMKWTLSLLAVVAFSGAVAQAQTIADLARQERTRRQSANKASVINNDAMKTTRPTAREEKLPLPELKTTAATTAEGADPSQPEVRDEKWWRSQFEKANGAVTRYENQVNVLELELNKAQTDFLTRAYDPGDKGRITIAETNKKLEAARKELAAAREKVGQLGEELRRAGAPASWAR